jgi:transcriptional regulator with XRE-family HTH domain
LRRQEPCPHEKNPVSERPAEQLRRYNRERIAASGMTQTEAAQRLGVGQSRVSDLMRGKWEKFSLEMLITATRIPLGRWSDRCYNPPVSSLAGNRRAYIYQS